jgi:hypothetical protein
VNKPAFPQEDNVYITGWDVVRSLVTLQSTFQIMFIDVKRGSESCTSFQYNLLGVDDFVSLNM